MKKERTVRSNGIIPLLAPAFAAIACFGIVTFSSYPQECVVPMIQNEYAAVYEQEGCGAFISPLLGNFENDMGEKSMIKAENSRMRTKTEYSKSQKSSNKIHMHHKS